MRIDRRRIRGFIAGATLAAGAVVAWQATAAAADDGGSGHGMERMAELMDAGNPGMARMHEQMMGNDGARRAHERMMQDAGMAQMHRRMTEAPQKGS